MVKLNQEQLTALKTFIQSRGIRYIDVQTEILDHVASAVEEKMSLQEQLKFEDALKQTHSSFGVFGFGGMEDAIMKGMNTKFRKVFWSNFRELLGLKYIALIILAGFLIYRAQVLINNTDVVQSILFVLLLGLFGVLIVLGLNQKRYHKFLTYKTSTTYLMLMGSFMTLINLATREITTGTVFGANVNYLIGTFIIVLFMVYLIAAFRTAMVGIKESKMLMKKYELLTY